MSAAQVEGAARGVARRNQRRGGPRALERVEVSRVVEEGQIVMARLLEGGDVVDCAAGVGAGSERRAAPARDFSERWR